MKFQGPEDFYRTYGRFKDYARPSLKPKHVRWFDREFWIPAAMGPDLAVLELGCGTGQFLLYLRAKGVRRFVGVDRDPAVRNVMEPDIAARVITADIAGALDRLTAEAPFDRIVLFDVLEHFAPWEGANLLLGLRNRLTPDGRVVVRVPNAASPWGQQHQHSDLTHKAAYTPTSLHQLALATGFACRAVLPQRRGSPVRRITEDVVNKLLSRLLTEPPPLWSANIVAVFEKAGVVPF